MTQAIMRPNRAAEYLGVSRRQLYNIAEQDPTFPRRIVFTARCVGWRKESLDEWLKQKEAGADL